MKNLFRLFGITAFVSIPLTLLAGEKGPMTPLSEEKLSSPIALSQECAGVTIVEWRVDGSPQTPLNSQAVQEIDRLCRLAVLRFPEFVKRQGYQFLHSGENFFQNISIIPADSYHRNLNDLESRFAGRTAEYDQDGHALPILGYHQRDAYYVYIFNEISLKDGINPQFKTVAAHEIFHALSSQFEIYIQHSGNKDEQEEKMARKFTMWLGLGE